MFVARCTGAWSMSGWSKVHNKCINYILMDHIYAYLFFVEEKNSKEMAVFINGINEFMWS